MSGSVYTDATWNTIRLEAKRTLVLAVALLSGCELLVFEGCEETDTPLAEVRIRAGYGGEAFDLHPTNDGGFILAGYKAARPYGSGGFEDSYDTHVIKTDGMGNVAWSTTYGVDGSDRGLRIRPFEDGYLVMGNAAREAGLFLLRIDETGNEIWRRNYGARTRDRGAGLCVDANGDIVVVGEAGAGGFVGEAFIAKLDADANELWRTIVSNKAYSAAEDVVATADGGFVLAGYQNQVLDNAFGNHTVEALTVKVDGNGEVIWKTIHPPAFLRGQYRWRSITLLDDGGFALVGYTGSESSVARITDRGARVWEVNRRGYIFAEGRDIVEAPDGSIVMAGISFTYNNPVAGLPLCNDYFVVRFSADGIEEWSEIYGAGNYEVANAIALGADGLFMVAGTDREPYVAQEGFGNIYLVMTDAGWNQDSKIVVRE